MRAPVSIIARRVSLCLSVALLGCSCCSAFCGLCLPPPPNLPARAHSALLHPRPSQPVRVLPSLGPLRFRLCPFILSISSLCPPLLPARAALAPLSARARPPALSPFSRFPLRYSFSLATSHLHPSPPHLPLHTNIVSFVAMLARYAGIASANLARSAAVPVVRSPRQFFSFPCHHLGSRSTVSNQKPHAAIIPSPATEW